MLQTYVLHRAILAHRRDCEIVGNGESNDTVRWHPARSDCSWASLGGKGEVARYGEVQVKSSKYFFRETGMHMPPDFVADRCACFHLPKSAEIC